MNEGECELAVVGGGILGLAVARELLRRRPSASVTVLEREPEVGTRQTGRNSGVIHAGIYYEPGSLKAKLCVEGARELYAYCEEHGIAHARCGKVIVALSDRELPRLDELERRGRANGVEGLRRLSTVELARVEPGAAGVAALHSPATGIVDFGAVARKLAEEAVESGATVATGCEVTAIESRDDGIAIRHSRGETRARRAIFCAGLAAARLARMAGASPEPHIVPFRGAYLRLREDRRHLVRGLVYPVPDPRLPFLGVHLTRTVDGEVLVGPTALMAGPGLAEAIRRPGTWRMMRRWWRTGLTELRHAASRRAVAADAARYLPSIGPDDVVAGPAGVRAQAVTAAGDLLDDFAFSTTGPALHVRNAPSPGATSALAIARLVADRAERELAL